MADVHTKETRSYNMSQIKGKNTRPEILVRKFLFSNGFRYRLHDKNLPGKPDIVFPKYSKVVFINGCYWHGHEECKFFVPPVTRTDWWMDKIESNRERDKRNIAELRKHNWQPIVVWECELKRDKREKTLQKLIIDILK